MPNTSPQNEQVLDSVKKSAKLKIERDLGPEILAALADSKTIEIMFNADGKLWQERLGEKMCSVGTISASLAESIIEPLPADIKAKKSRSMPTPFFGVAKIRRNAPAFRRVIDQ